VIPEGPAAVHRSPRCQREKALQRFPRQHRFQRGSAERGHPAQQLGACPRETSSAPIVSTIPSAADRPVEPETIQAPAWRRQRSASRPELKPN